VADEELVYLDSSAFVKLVIAALPATARLVASEILEVEVLRAARRANGDDGAAAARAQLAGVRLLPMTDEIRGRAGELEPATLRSFDAIHIATALDLGERLACVYAYDIQMATAASDAGLHVYAPTPEQPTGEDTHADQPALRART
jgi:predicted nucleic acid-binding protein